jgi:hypothetical protein
VKRVNELQVGGYEDHIPDDERATRKPPMRWLKAIFPEGQDTAWGKVYVEPDAEITLGGQAVNLRQAFKQAMKDKRTANVSIWGSAMQKQDGEWDDLDLRGIDVSLEKPPSVPTLAVVPEPVSEFKESEKPVMDEVNVAELQASLTTWQSVAELIGGGDASAVKTRVTELLTIEKAYQGLKQQQRETHVAELVTQEVGEVLGKLVPVFVRELAVKEDEADVVIKARVAELMETPMWKEEAEVRKVAMAGPTAIVGGHDTRNKPAPKLTEEEANALGAKYNYR